MTFGDTWRGRVTPRPARTHTPLSLTHTHTHTHIHTDTHTDTHTQTHCKRVDKTAKKKDNSKLFVLFFYFSYDYNKKYILVLSNY